MVQDSHFADGDLKFRHILVIELKFKLSPKSFAHVPGRFQEIRKTCAFLKIEMGK